MKPTNEMIEAVIKEIDGERPIYVGRKEIEIMITAALALLPGEMIQKVVKFPTTADEAEAMEKVGFAYLKVHAPERLTAEGFSRPIPALIDSAWIMEEAMTVIEPFNKLAAAVFYVDEDGKEMNASKSDDQTVWGFDDAHITYGDLRAVRALLLKLEGSSHAKA